MYTGTCLCGTIEFEIHGPIQNIVHCHCSQCRKAQGTAFATNGNVASDKFKFIHGEDQLSEYPYTPTQTKYFCQHCGSPIMSKNTLHPRLIRIRLGSIESPIQERPEAHIFVTSKALWDVINDNLPQHDDYKPS